MYEPFAITEIRTETRNTKTFVLRPTNAFRYDAGQFLTLVFPKPDGEARRNYSFSSTPGVDDLPAITVKRIDNGEFSRRLFDYAAVGDTLLTVGAFGFFALPEKLPKRLFFLAAGSGIAPIFSLIKSLLYQHAEQEIVLIYSNRSPEETIFFDELNGLSQQFKKRFVLECLFSTARDLSRARLGKALLEKFVNQYAPDKHNTLFYICGPFDYMRMANVVLLAEGIPDSHIRRENFVVHKPVIKALPPDTDSHAVTIGIAGNTYALKTQFPETILVQAKKQGIPIPYSCESGQCGTCAATCTQGHVWMSYNEVLTDKDLKLGRVLTCTGVPYGGDVVLEM